MGNPSFWREVRARGGKRGVHSQPDDFGMLSGQGPIIQKVSIFSEELAVGGTRKTGKTTVGSSR